MELFDGVSAISPGLKEPKIGSVIILDSDTTSALASLLYYLDDLRIEANGKPIHCIAPNHLESLHELRKRAFGY